MTQGADKYFAPAAELGGLAVEHITKLMSMQLKRFEETTAAGLERMQAACAVRDVEGMTKYLSDSTATLQQMAERGMADARALVEMGGSYADRAQRICRDAFTKA